MKKSSKFKLNLLSCAISVALFTPLVVFAAVSESDKASLGANPAEEIKLFHQDLKDQGSDGVPIWRIPSLINTKDGVLIAAADKRWQHRGDWGDIDSAIRISQDNGKTWGDITTILNLVSRNGERSPIVQDAANFNPWAHRKGTDATYRNSAFTMDSQMLQDRNTGRIFMAVDMFPESTGLSQPTDNGVTESGSGYVNIGGKQYLKLKKDGKQWTLRENGEVFDENNQKTTYRVDMNGDPARNFHNLGDVYGSNNEKLGNIYLKKEGNNSKVPFTITHTSYFWLIHSDDNGKTWSQPVDLTPQVKQSWMRFFGTGPGVGIQTKNGNLIFPVYYFNTHGKQSSALIISQDGGKTWNLGQSPNDTRAELQGQNSQTLNNNSGNNKELTESQLVELDNGDIKLFMRNNSQRVIMATSKDGGYTWSKTETIDALKHGYSQMSVIKYSKRIDGKEYIIFSGQSQPGTSGDQYRRDGKLFLGEVQEDGNIKWDTVKLVREIKSSGVAVQNGTRYNNGYVYSSMAELNNGNIGLAYENTTEYTTIMYLPIDLQEFFWKNNQIFSDRRREAPLVITYNGNESLEKIGDGEAVKEGSGMSNATVAVKEGILSLNSATAQDRAFANISVHKNGTLRIKKWDATPKENISLNSGTLDLYGNDLTLSDDSKNTGLYTKKLNSNIVNNNAQKASTLYYQLSDDHEIAGQVGNESGKLNLFYNPAQDRGDLLLSGNSHLNQLGVQKGSVTLGTASKNNIAQASVANGAKLVLEHNATAAMNSLAIERSGLVMTKTETGNATTLNANTQGTGGLLKQGEGTLNLVGTFNHSGDTNLQGGTTNLLGNINQSAVTLGARSMLTGAGYIANVTLENTSMLILNPTATANNYTPATMKFDKLTVKDGATIGLMVNNTAEPVANWQHDRIVAKQIESTERIPLAIHYWGRDFSSNSDTNGNGKYDADEGISVIQALNVSRLDQFWLVPGVLRAATVHPMTLVNVERGAANAADNLQGTDSAFYDYRIQTRLVTESGAPVDNNIRYVSPKPTDPTRYAVTPDIPTVLSTNTALFNQGNGLVNSFMDNIAPWFGDKKGFYVIQQHNNSNFGSDLSFQNYGYDYKSKQNRTLFGGYFPVSANSELHLGAGLSSQKVTPKAVDGSSSAKYKTTSLMAALHNQWDKFSLDLGLAYHWHRGDISTGEKKDIVDVKGKHLQMFTRVGYDIPFGKFTVTPVLGLNYQYLDTDLRDKGGRNWNIRNDNQNVLTTQAGTHFTWQGDMLRLKADVLYENNSGNRGNVLITDTQTHQFTTSRLGNAMLYKVGAEVAVTPAFTVGVHYNHRQALSGKGAEQNSIMGKLEYKF
ncbi:BNR repeat protein [Cricetibacter osteomyelitidis]|uniref:exo-alpha-sialidase n=1 Tax=Cricetibacter osteomyelitidis TaxID=1521931 RepID=A0A4R2T0G6_9PAST|nr:exo-alpha-sialidase [Cricetibacter osteomyelitidis]TCP95355.1 BNR repeat protein [Cricetibacter osteomyelitidis]